MDFRPFFRLAALILASIEIAQDSGSKREQDIIARAEKYAAFINQDKPMDSNPEPAA